MRNALRRSITGQKRMHPAWPVFLALCALLVTVGCSGNAGNTGEIPPAEPDPIEEEEPPAASGPEEPGEERPQNQEKPGEMPGGEEVPDAQETPGGEAAPGTGETPAENPAGTIPSLVSFSQEGLDELVQQAIDKIITPEMTKLEQAKAVWDFTKGGISYTGKSDKSNWQAGAYEGLSKRRGDCFTYYAVSRALLTALGIDNLEVQRVGGPTSHYWNLVNCGDGWYHFDATPRSSKMPYFVSFMFTDEEAADYTARAGRNYYSFDGSLYPERAGGTEEKPAQPSSSVESPAPETPPTENPAPEAPPAENPPADTDSEPLPPEDTDNETFPIDVVELPPSPETE